MSSNGLYEARRLLRAESAHHVQAETDGGLRRHKEVRMHSGALP
jgi:hypothetical protein